MKILVDTSIWSLALRKNGIQGSHIDFLIYAAAINHHLPIFTTDNDFESYRKIIDFDLHEIRNELRHQ